MAERTSWTDERMDDFVAHLNARFDQTDARLGSLEARMDTGFNRIDARLDRMSDQMISMQRQIATGAWMITAVLLAQVIALVVTNAG